MDLFDAASHGGSAEQALRRVKASRALIVGVTTDFLFPLHQQEELANALRLTVPEVDFRALPSISGHDSFLVDMNRFRPTVASFF
jgi:homoserine acetyltransferase